MHTRFAAAALACLPLPAIAQEQTCAPFTIIVTAMAHQTGQTLRATMPRAGGTIWHVWANDHTGQWTLTSTAPGGPTCVVMGGHDFAAPVEADT